MRSGHSDVVHDVIRRLQPLATPLRAVLDLLVWIIATTVALYLRFDLDPPQNELDGLKRMIPLAAALQLVVGFLVGLYRRRWLYGSYDEVSALVVTAGITTTSLFVLNGFYFDTRPVPQSVILVGGVFGLCGMAAVRYIWRLVLERMRRPVSPDAERTIVYGVGEDGQRVVISLLRSRDSRLIPVALLDDRPDRQRLSIMGIQVKGGRAELPEVAESTGATVLLIADRSATTATVNELVDLASGAGLRVKVLPPIDERVDETVGGPPIRDLTEVDLLGRHQVQTNLVEIAHYLTGRTVLVTGAGGSIGSELCRQLHAFSPKRLVMLDRDESALHAVELSIHGRALLDSGNTVLADIRDGEVIDGLFSTIRPDVVFHAAALKHLPLLEQFPDEAFKTNILGTLNVLRAAQNCGVAVFVNVSTDKAANPTSVLGYSKRVAERLTSYVGTETTVGNYLSVRFGNVLGSRGSVLVAFRDQIERGGPVTITDESVTRFFMTVGEAVQLVIQAGAIGRSGEVLVLDMGAPVRIYDVARRLIAQSGRDIKIDITGLRPGEKLHEELLGPGEVDERPRHPLISHAAVPPLDPDQLVEPASGTRSWMVQTCTVRS